MNPVAMTAGQKNKKYSIDDHPELKKMIIIIINYGQFWAKPSRILDEKS
jgi:hypothetical protein